ncbi:hypothetical protein FGO68_gene4499 [Halteria grandinella]|uniref:Rab-GAP TBC domain-containing protein n=1 Tax=Halteria grandinella TaxID=5974 RepID=A0A8J8T2U9_HALGN|nr:hypothetical protein FGO68_gene4499 [Halteria grandinella]
MEIEKLIVKDVPRTFGGTFERPSPSTGKNRLFNLLKVYSLLHPEVGYTQGMSFIAGLVLMLFDQKEEKDSDYLSLMIFKSLMTECSDWYRFYSDNTPKLFLFTKDIRDHLRLNHPLIHKALLDHNVILESLLASPLFTIFSNLIPVEQSYQVLERYILDGDEAIHRIFHHLFRVYEGEIVRMDCWDMQMFLGRKMYERAIDSCKFFPNDQL